MAQTEYIYADIDEMLFEHRERTYGAYELRKQYHKRLFRALAFVFLLFFAGIIGPHIAGLMAEPESNLSEFDGPVIVNPIPEEPVVKEKKIIQPPPQQPKPNKQVAFNIPEPTPEDELEPDEIDNSINDQKLLAENKNIGLNDVEGEDESDFFSGEIDGVGEIPEVIQAEPEPSPQDFVAVDQEPQPVNINDIKQKIGYPQMARDIALEGNVVVRVLVDEYGKYQKHIVINNVHPILSGEVEKHLSELKFTPAIQGNKPIKFWVNIPFSFKLMN